MAECWRGAVPPKRYVLLLSDVEFSDVEEELTEYMRKRFGSVKLIPVPDNPRAVIVKTDVEVAARIRELIGSLAIGGRHLTPVLTSGAVGNLKKRGREAAANGQVHE